MPSITEIRQQFPQYSDMSDEDLAGALHKKFYSDMPRADFDAKVGLAKPQTPASNVGMDVAKQIGSGLVTGTEAIPAAVPSVLGALGGLVERAFPGDQTAIQEREKLRGMIEANRGGGIAQYLPKPETTAGEFARAGAEAIPGMIGATKLSPVRAAVAGATSGLTSEAAGQATKGTEAEVPARIIGAVVGGGGAIRQAERAAAQRATPTIAELHAKAGAGYQAARETGTTIKPAAAEGLAARLKAELTEAGLDENIAPKTWGILSKLEGAPSDAFMTVQNFQSLRRTLGNAAGSIDRSERLAAVQAKNAVDDFLANLPTDAVLAGNPRKASALLKEANANYAAAERAADLDRRLVRAQLRASAANSGMNVANTIRGRMADILVTPKLQRGYSQAELRQMERIVRGGALENALRMASNITGGGGGALTAGYGLTAYGTGDPNLAAVPLLGFGLRGLSNMRAMQEVGRLNAMTRARSPMAAQRNIPLSSPAAPIGGLLSMAGRLPGQ